MTAHMICRDGVSVGSSSDAETALRIARDYKSEFPSDVVTVVLDTETPAEQVRVSPINEPTDCTCDYNPTHADWCVLSLSSARDDISETTRIEAIERFRVAFESFYSAGMDLVEAWDDSDAAFNADLEWPLPEKIRPPMSLDEWLMELREHYLRENEAVSDEDEIHDRIIVS